MLSDFVTCWDDLEVLETGAVNVQALQRLASLKKLRELKMLVPEGLSLDLDPTSTFSVMFSLDEFSITAANIELLRTQMISTTYFPPLLSISNPMF